MILYRYVNLQTVFLILDGYTFKFSGLFSFNDQFEVSYLYYELN